MCSSDLKSKASGYKLNPDHVEINGDFVRGAAPVKETPKPTIAAAVPGKEAGTMTYNGKTYQRTGSGPNDWKVLP